MRDGVLLAQSSPTALLKAYNTTVSYSYNFFMQASKLLVLMIIQRLLLDCRSTIFVAFIYWNISLYK